MRPPIYLGDEVSAAGYRLAGLRVRIPAGGQASAALAWARENAPLVLVSAAVAREIPEVSLRTAIAARRPLVLVVGDVVAGTPAPDVARRIRARLGMEA